MEKMLYHVIITLLLAVSPLSECRGAIPYGLIIGGLDVFTVFFVALVGNMVPVPILLYTLGRLEKIMEKRGKDRSSITNIIAKKYFSYVGRVRVKAKPYLDKYGVIGLAVFVAIPLPATGAWTGCVIAHVLGYPREKALISIALGVIGASVIVLILTFFLDLILTFFKVIFIP